MPEKIEEARREFNAILDYILQEALGLEIHNVEHGIYQRLLRLGRILIELFVLAIGTGKIGEALIDRDGTIGIFGTRVAGICLSSVRLR